MDQTFLIATVWIFLAFMASLISIRLGISLALIEIIVGVVAGNVIHLQITDWVNFLASLGAVILTFLAGAEIDPASLKKNLKQSVVIGFLSFLLPCVCGMLVAYYLLGWDVNASKITGIALSTTSVAVVYAVMVESRLSSTSFGQSILAACFITDLGTVLALGLLFTGFSYKLLIFAGAVIVVCFAGIPLAKRIFERYSGKVSEPEIKFVLLILVLLGYLAVYSGSEAVLPAYIIGLAMAGFFLQYKETLHKMRAIAFVAFTPFYFIKAGSLVSLKTLTVTFSLIVILLLVKVGAKFIGVLPATKFFNFKRREGIYTTLLMSTGLTFGTISALYGITNKYINSSQYSVIVTVVILSAVIPTLIAQKFFFPKKVLQEQVLQGGHDDGSR
ncbi:cation:proton antiporter [Dehalobacter sp. CF]|uniref:cation:proton antiporter n=1 Tax=Dehalobacter sp. CF TaxID=1131462 RepID=UPI00028AC13B|nr:cation:proton antiporter [Dehalobacter sp. CF]AFV04220.1 Na+/H+ antiporter [Dehalobacter sp. CF]